MLRRAVRVLTGVILATLLGLPPAQAASETPTYGGKGGAPFRAQCPAGSYLVGIRARAGRLVDRVGAVCAAWDAVHVTAAPSRDQRAEFGGPGGSWTRFGCPSGSALFGMLVEQSLHNSPDVVGSLSKPQCRSLANPGLSVFTEDHLIGTVQGNGGFPAHFSSALTIACPAGQVGVGIYGASGTYVDQLGLLCDTPARAGAAPTPPAAAVTVATAKDDVDVYDQPNGDTGHVIGMIKQGARHNVLATSEGWSQLLGAPSADRNGWVANDHLTLSH